MKKIARLLLTGLLAASVFEFSVATAAVKTKDQATTKNAELYASAKESKVAEVTSAKETDPTEPTSKPNSEKGDKSEKAVVTFKDGSKITEKEINDEINSIPEQLSGKMSLLEIKSFLSWKAAYKKVMDSVSKKSAVADKQHVRDVIAKRKATVSGFMLLDEKAKELMTTESLRKHYFEVWDKNFKGTKEFYLYAITTTDKNVADSIKKHVKDEKTLNKELDSNKATTKHMAMDARPEGMFPPEISSAVLKNGVNSVVGPFKIQGTYMLFFVKRIENAKKQDFTPEFEENYKKVASKDFIKEYTQNLYKKYKVKIMDVNGKESDPFKTLDKDKKKEKNKKAADLNKIKDDLVLATIDGDKITAADVKLFFKTGSSAEESFASMIKQMAKQFSITPEEVLVYAVKLVADDKVLAKEVTNTKYDQKKEVDEKLQEIANMEIQHAYFKEHVKIKSEDIHRTFKKFMESIPEEEKNDNEIATRMMFFKTKEEASNAMKSISSGQAKFGDLFKEKSVSDKSAIDLGYVKKRGTEPEIWAMLKRGSSGTCCKEIVELDGAKFGVAGMNYAIVYVADRRPITLPSLSNPSEKQYFQKMAEREKAVELVKTHFVSKIKTIDGKSMEDWIKNPEYVEKMLSVLVGSAS